MTTFIYRIIMSDGKILTATMNAADDYLAEQALIKYYHIASHQIHKIGSLTGHYCGIEISGQPEIHMIVTNKNGDHNP